VAWGNNTFGDTDSFITLLSANGTTVLTPASVRNVTAGESVADDVGDLTLTGFGSLGQLAVFHTNLTDGDVDGEQLQGVRTMTSDGAGDSMIGDSFIDIILGNGGDDFLYGNNNTDELYGGNGLDYLSGGNENDYLSGGAEKDIFFGGGGVDIMTGGDGDDEYYIGATDLNDIIAEIAGGGNDRIFASVSYALGASSEVETIGTDNNSGVTAINLTGSNLANVVIGNNGVNILDGKGGNDILYGLSGTDYFAFSTAPNGATNIDTIADFASVDDLFFLDDAIFTTFSPGTVAAVYFRSAAGAVSAAGADRIVHNSTTGDLYYDADGVGGTASVRFANIGAGTAVFNYDFFVY
jgi:Ca2+-binding RTX toxin-like protein